MATIHLTADNFEKEVQQSELPVIVDFWASWCPPCRMLGPIFEEASDDADLKGKIKFGKLSTEEHPEISGAHGVISIPTMIIFKDGKEADRLVGAMPKDVLKEEILKRI